MRWNIRVLVISAALLAGLPSAAQAVILSSTPNRNLRAPANGFANSGWQWEGQWRGFLGTAISKKFFITAGHIGGFVGDTFVYGGRNYTVTDVWGDTKSDLRLYKVDGSFRTWAPLYTGSDEVGQAAMMFGRGTKRGDGVFVGRQPKGWKWGAEDGRQSWGRNIVNSIATGESNIGSLLALNFDEKRIPYEGGLSRGDSGGGTFLLKNGVWQLAGVNYSTDGPYSFTTSGVTFDASLFDRGGLWAESTGLVADTAKNIPSASYATRVSARMSWIGDVFSGRIAPGVPAAGSANVVPEPNSAAIVLIVAFKLMCRRRTNTQPLQVC